MLATEPSRIHRLGLVENDSQPHLYDYRQLSSACLFSYMGKTVHVIYNPTYGTRNRWSCLWFRLHMLRPVLLSFSEYSARATLPYSHFGKRGKLKISY